MYVIVCGEWLEEEKLRPAVKHVGGIVMGRGRAASSGMGHFRFMEDKINKHDDVNIL